MSNKKDVDNVVPFKQEKPQHPIYSGDVPFITFTYNNTDGSIISLGKLMGTKGIFSFEGNVEASAEVFFNHLTDLLNNQMEEIKSNIIEDYKRDRNNG